MFFPKLERLGSSKVKAHTIQTIMMCGYVGGGEPPPQVPMFSSLILVYDPDAEGAVFNINKLG